jgi:hypothetical protein
MRLSGMGGRLDIIEFKAGTAARDIHGRESDDASGQTSINRLY